ncbi:tetratricopeptide repeat protein, partial [Planobispora longispora]|uniref:tetratricopeptide repeat protein n=3 Tax=Planobispora longispora TaxID=28887 RepID=UPI001EF727A8
RDDRGGERPSYGDRDERGGERRSYGDRDQVRSQYGFRDRDDRQGGGFRNRDDRPGGGFRGRDDRGGERRPFSRDDRPGGRPSGDRPGGFRSEGGSRTRYGREDQPGGRDDEASARERENMPQLAPDIEAEELDKEIRDELRSLPLDLADLISRHLVAAERALSAGEPEAAYEHAKVARGLAPRIGVVREAVGIAAYYAEHFAEALSDLRTARRITGSDEFLPIMADCERGLGRPERALDLVRSKEAERLDREGKIELAIVESGARRDLGQKDAAVVTLQRLAELRDPRPQPWSARLAFAYADALADAGHEGAAVEWFGRAMTFDEDGETAAAERYAELTGTVIEDLEEDFEDESDGDAGLEDAPGDESGGPVSENEIEADLDDDLDEDDLDEDDEDDEIDEIDDVDDDLDDEEIGEPAAGEDEEDGPHAAASSRTEDRGDEGRPERAETGVGPAFIEPNFGDILDDADDADDEADEADDSDTGKNDK